MIQEVIEKWHKNKNKLQKWFEENTYDKYSDYKQIVEAISSIILEYAEPEVTEIDNGSYQGTSVFVIVDKDDNYYDIDDYLFTFNYYGSCSGCDTLQGIIMYIDYETKIPNEEQVKELMLLSLHLIQRIQKLS